MRLKFNTTTTLLTQVFFLKVSWKNIPRNFAKKNQENLHTV